MAAAAPLAEMSTSARLAAAPPYSFAGDPAVQPFDNSRGLIIYDGVCVLCSRTMRAIAEHDRTGHYQFASAQSPLGQALYKHYGLDPKIFETVLLIDQGCAYGKLDTVAELA